MSQFRAWLQSVFSKIRVGLIRFMTGRHGADELSLFTLLSGLILSLLGSLFGSFLLILLGYAAEIYTIFRIFSRKLDKREMENRKYVSWSKNLRFQIKAFFLRLKMRRQYKYFRCPECKSLMRLQRGCGEVQMECPKCHAHFSKKA